MDPTVPGWPDPSAPGLPLLLLTWQAQWKRACCSCPSLPLFSHFTLSDSPPAPTVRCRRPSGWLESVWHLTTSVSLATRCTRGPGDSVASLHSSSLAWMEACNPSRTELFKVRGVAWLWHSIACLMWMQMLSDEEACLEIFVTDSVWPWFDDLWPCRQEGRKQRPRLILVTKVAPSPVAMAVCVGTSSTKPNWVAVAPLPFWHTENTWTPPAEPLTATPSSSRSSPPTLPRSSLSMITFTTSIMHFLLLLPPAEPSLSVIPHALFLQLSPRVPL